MSAKLSNSPGKRKTSRKRKTGISEFGFPLDSLQEGGTELPEFSVVKSSSPNKLTFSQRSPLKKLSSVNSNESLTNSEINTPKLDPSKSNADEIIRDVVRRETRIKSMKSSTKLEPEHNLMSYQIEPDVIFKVSAKII